MNWKCFFGLHDWTDRRVNRYVSRDYDTYFKDGKEWGKMEIFLSRLCVRCGRQETKKRTYAILIIEAQDD